MDPGSGAGGRTSAAGAGRATPGRTISAKPVVVEPPSTAPDGASWKLAEYERHFNTIQAGIRGLASVWLLATFGSLATLLKEKEAEALWVPTEWVIVAICAMGSTGLALLWVIDQLVYHRLLNAAFIVGLKLEKDDRSLPPLHASMYASMPKRGYAALLSLFYFAPIAALAAAALADAGYALSQDARASSVGLLALAFIPGIIGGTIVFIGRRERDFFAAHARHFGDREFSELFERSPRAKGFSALLRQDARDDSAARRPSE
jgi:hypothetical protein